MIDRYTDSLYRPAFIGAWVGVIVVFAVIVTGETSMAVTKPIILILGILTTLIFSMALLDAPTRRAVDAYNAHAYATRRKSSFLEKLFPTDMADRGLLIVNRLAALQGFLVLAAYDNEHLLGFVCVESFALSTLMLMLMLKRSGWGEKI